MLFREETEQEHELELASLESVGPKTEDESGNEFLVGQLIVLGVPKDSSSWILDIYESRA